MRISRRTLTLLAGLAVAVGTVGCGDGADDEPPAAGTEAQAEPLEIAFLNPSAANTWLLKTREAMERVASDRGGVKITEFDSEFSVDKQAQQLQDVIASGKYDAVMINPTGAGLIPDVEAAVDAGLEVGLVGQILGDRLDTADPQVDGVAVSVVVPPLRSGERLAELTIEACEGKDPCRVVYFYGIKGAPGDVAYKQGFDAGIEEQPHIRIVAEGEGKYLGPDVALAAMQDILQSTPEFEVVVGSDQAMQGVQQALEEAGKLDGVAIIGLGGSQAAIEAVRDGIWFGEVFGAPQTEGELAMSALLEAIDEGTETGGIDPLTTVPNDGLITKDNVDEFEPEWVG
jgi:ribose transport system substrate-binding protein